MLLTGRRNPPLRISNRCAAAAEIASEPRAASARQNCRSSHAAASLPATEPRRRTFGSTIQPAVYDGAERDYGTRIPDTAGSFAGDGVPSLAACESYASRVHPNEALIRAAYDAMAAGDSASLAELLMPTTQWIVAGHGPLAGTYTGPKEIFGLWGTSRHRPVVVCVCRLRTSLPTTLEPSCSSSPPAAEERVGSMSAKSLCLTSTRTRCTQRDSSTRIQTPTTSSGPTDPAVRDAGLARYARSSRTRPPRCSPAARLVVPQSHGDAPSHCVGVGRSRRRAPIRL